MLPPAGIVTGATYYGNGVNLTGVVTSVTAGAGVQISPVSGQGRVTISGNWCLVLDMQQTPVLQPMLRVV